MTAFDRKDSYAYVHELQRSNMDVWPEGAGQGAVLQWTDEYLAATNFCHKYYHVKQYRSLLHLVKKLASEDLLRDTFFKLAD